MSLIDRAATFRGIVTDHGVSLTKNEWPQWIAQLQAVEIYDDEEKVWVDWTDVEEREITAYQVLLGSKGETLNAQQIKKAIGWDGVSYSGLAALDLSEAKVQFRVETNVYEGKETLQVNWIDEYDAEPGRSVRKLDADGLREIDAKYKRYLNPTKKVTPAKKPTTPPAVKAKGVKPTQPKAPVTKKPKKGAVDPLGPPEGPVTPKQAAEPSIPTPPSQAVGTCTKQEVWDEVVEKTKEKRANGEISDSQLSEAWTGAVGKFGNDPDKLTGEQWYQVRIDILDKLVEIPF